jgi:hypothetical protein
MMAKYIGGAIPDSLALETTHRSSWGAKRV